MTDVNAATAWKPPKRERLVDLAEVETGPHGGRASKLQARCDLLPWGALLECGERMAAGVAAYGECDNYLAVEYKRHVEHAVDHLARQLAGEEDDDHLVAAAVRLLMAIQVRKNGGPRALDFCHDDASV